MTSWRWLHDACPSVSTLTWSSKTNSGKVCSLSTLARRVCTIRTLMCRLGHAILKDRQEKAIPPHRMTQRKSSVREWLVRRPKFGQYGNQLTELHKKEQMGYKNYLRITPDLFQEMSWHGVHCHALARIIPHCHDEFTNSWRIVHDPFWKFRRDQNFKHFKILIPTWHVVTTVFEHTVTMRATESCKWALVW